MTNYTTEDVHISRIANGDTIIHSDGFIRTVCESDIKNGGFCGTTLFGDSYAMGTKPVKRITLITGK